MRLSVAQNTRKNPTFKGLPVLCQEWGQKNGALMVSKVAWLEQAKYDTFVPSKSEELGEQVFQSLGEENTPNNFLLPEPDLKQCLYYKYSFQQLCFCPSPTYTLEVPFLL